MTIEESRRYFEKRMKLRIKEETFAVIDEQQCVWVAEVETTDLTENESFFILVRGTMHFMIEKSWRHKLGYWFSRHL